MKVLIIFIAADTGAPDIEGGAPLAEEARLTEAPTGGTPLDGDVGAGGAPLDGEADDGSASNGASIVDEEPKENTITIGVASSGGNFIYTIDGEKSDDYKWKKEAGE